MKSNSSQGQFKAIQSEIKNNEVAARKILQKRKFKNFNTLKYKPNATTQPLTQQLFDSDILKRKKSKSNKLANKPITVGQLKSSNINN